MIKNSCISDIQNADIAEIFHKNNSRRKDNNAVIKNLKAVQSFHQNSSSILFQKTVENPNAIAAQNAAKNGGEKTSNEISIEEKFLKDKKNAEKIAIIPHK